MNNVRRVLTSGVFGIAGLALAVVALAVLPIYGSFMVIWMHVPLVNILVTVGPLAAIFSIGAYATLRAGRLACKGGT
jgi:hypothetical protein